jgi:pimeloyl-ACP methyl ester carboxylesterase
MALISEILLPVRHKAREFKLSAWFRDSGQDLVVFVHGLGCSKDNWRKAWEHRALRGMSLLAVDLPGSGHSPGVPDFSYELEDYAGILAALIDAYAVRDVHLVAHSMGGTIALLLPVRTLARFRNLALVEPRLVQSSCGIAAEAVQGSFEQFAAEIYPRFRQRLSVDPRTAYDLDRADPDGFYKSGCSMMRWTAGDEMLQRFAGAPGRKAFIYGGNNRHLEELGRIDESCKIEIPRAGHFVMHDDPQAFYHQLGALLSET